jgi:23S rRNA pseudouridine1911/1915/1917 synthase
MPQIQAQTNTENPANILLSIPMDLGGKRLDVALQQLLPEHSRSRLQAWIKAGLVALNGEATTAKTKVWGGEQILISPPENAQENAFKPENIPLDIVFEDDTILVINKRRFGGTPGGWQLERYTVECIIASRPTT